MLSTEQYISTLYATLFNRAPDLNGLNFWKQNIKNLDLSNIENYQALTQSMAKHSLFTQGYDTLDNQTLVNKLYQDLLGGTDEEGISYWLGRLEQGQNRLDMMSDFVHSALNFTASDASTLSTEQLMAAQNRQQTLINKANAGIDFANTYTQASNITFPDAITTDAAYQASILAIQGIDHSPGSLEKAKQQVHLTIKGVAIDGYVRGAKVFEDINANQVHDEPWEPHTFTDEFGNFDFNESARFGKLILTGGIDISTGKPFEGQMEAAPGATVINPLTTLVNKVSENQNITPEQAAQQISNQLGIDKDVDLFHFDPIAKSSDPNASETEKKQALEVHSNAIQINTLVSQIGALLSGSKVSKNEDDGIKKAYTALAKSLGQKNQSNEPEQAQFALDSKQNLDLILEQTKSEQNDEQRQHFNKLIGDASKTIANLNKAIKTESQNSQDIEHTLVRIASIQLVAEEVEDKIEQQAPSGDISQGSSQTEGSHFNQALEQASRNIGDVDGDNDGDALSNNSDTNSGASNATSPPPPPPLPESVSFSSAAFNENTQVLSLSGSDLNHLLQTGEDQNSDIKARLDWSKLHWDIDADDETTANVHFQLSDINSAFVLSDSELQISLSTTAAQALVSASEYTGTVADTLDILAGFTQDTAGNPASTDALSDASINITLENTKTDKFSSISVISSFHQNPNIPNNAPSKTHDPNQTIEGKLNAPLASDEFLEIKVNNDNWLSLPNNKINGVDFEWDISLRESSNNIKLRVSDTQGNHSPVESRYPYLDSQEPDVTITGASFNPTAHTLVLTGENFFKIQQDESVSAGGGPHIPVQNLFDWSKLTWQYNGSTLAHDTVIFPYNLIADAKTTSDTTLTITLVPIKTGEIVSNPKYDPLTGDDRISIATGFIHDHVNTPAITDAFFGPDDVAPIVSINHISFDERTGIFNLPGSGFNSLLSPLENNTNDIKGRLDWSKFSLQVVNGQTLNFSANDFEYVKATNDNSLAIRLNVDKHIELLREETSHGSYNFNVDIENGFSRDLAGNVATSDAYSANNIQIMRDSTIPNPAIQTKPSISDLGAELNGNYYTNSANQNMIIQLFLSLPEREFVEASLTPVGNTPSVVNLTEQLNTTSNQIQWSISLSEGENQASVYLSDVINNTNSRFDFSIFLDITAPTSTISDASYNSTTRTLILTGTDFNQVLETGEDQSSDIKSRLDWSKLHWDVDSDNTDNISFALSDIESVNVSATNQLSIVLSSAKDTALQGTNGYDPLTTNDSLKILAGFIGDIAGNKASSDAFDSALANPNSNQLSEELVIIGQQIELM